MTVIKKETKSEGLKAINNTNPCAAGQLALHFFTFLKTKLGLTLLVK